MIHIIHGEIWSNDFSQLNQLIADYSSCVRFSFCRFQKDNLEFNSVRVLAKTKYKTLNTRQISDAVMQAQALLSSRIEIEKERATEKGTKPRDTKDLKTIFGNKDSWKDYFKSKITKKQWKDKRDGQIYARGDATHSGNPNIRIINNSLRITIGNRKFVSYNLFIPKKYQEELQWLLASGQAYNVRLTRKDAQHFCVNIDYSTEDPVCTIGFDAGAIGIDINPDRIAVANTDKDGSFINSFSICNQKILYASTEKREYEISLLVKQVIQYAKDRQKGIVFENLKFNHEFDSDRKFNRIKSNFVFRKFLTLLENKCVENGIEFKKVHPAYTSIIGRLKYKELYQLNVHESAAYVIARRGFGFNEKLSLSHHPKKRVKEAVLCHLAGKKNKRVHSWRMWKILKDNEKAVLTGLSSRMSNLQELDVSSFDELENGGENPPGEIFLKELVVGSGSGRSFLGKRKVVFKTDC